MDVEVDAQISVPTLRPRRPGEQLVGLVLHPQEELIDRILTGGGARVPAVPRLVKGGGVVPVAHISPTLDENHRASRREPHSAKQTRRKSGVLICSHPRQSAKHEKIEVEKTFAN